MRSIVLRYGLIAGGIIIGASIIALIINGKEMDLDTGAVIGWTSMLLALTFVYIGVRSYRLQLPDQSITFGKAFLTGFLISLVATAFWAGGWEVYMATSDGNFYQHYADHKIASLQASGATEAEIEEARTDSQNIVDMAKNPFLRVAMSSMEILPVGLLISLISGLIESRRKAKTTDS
jgi:hypothetical protein